MTLKDLHNKLRELGIQEDKYYLHGLFGSTNDEDKLALAIRRGVYFVEYEVYYKERGEINSIKIFTKEEDACKYLYNRFKKEKEIEDKYSK